MLSNLYSDDSLPSDIEHYTRNSRPAVHEPSELPEAHVNSGGVQIHHHTIADTDTSHNKNLVAEHIERFHKRRD